jgi:sigma-B regulation protein RsbU (phosphoserine phosphatase)
MPNKKHRFGINGKILTIVLGVSCLALLIFLLISYYSMKAQRKYALNSSEKFGKEAAGKSMASLEDLAKRYLLELVVSQAETSNMIFHNFVDDIVNLSKFTEEIYLNPGKINNDKYYSASNPPMDVNKHSMYHLVPGVKENQVAGELRKLAGLDYYFRAVWQTREKDLRSFYLGTVSGCFVRWPWTSVIKKDYDFRKRIWFKQALKSRRPGWTAPYRSANSSTMMVSCYCPVFDAEKNIVAVAAADITIDRLIEIISTHVKNIGYAVLMDKQGKIVARPGEQHVGEGGKEAEYFSIEPFWDDNDELKKIARAMVQGKTGIGRYMGADNQEKFIGYAPEPSTGWSLGVIVPVEAVIRSALETKQRIKENSKQTEIEISEFMKDMQQETAIAFVIIICLIVFVSINFSRKITGPISLLAERTDKIGHGDLDQDIPVVKTNDEIQDLSISFNQMLTNLKNYINQLKETTAAKERIESELQLAHDIQAGMLPQEFPPFPDRDEFDIYALMEPAREVGGDLYDFFFINQNTLCFFVGDVSGKGVPASLFMMVAKVLLHREANQELITAGQIFKNVNRMLCQDNQQCLFVTAFIGLLNLESGELQYADAGHNPPLFYSKQNDSFEYMTKQKSCAMGIVEEFEFKDQQMVFNPGDKIFVYSDGVTDAVNPGNEMFSEERLLEELNNKKNQDVTSIIKGIKGDISTFIDGSEPFDDITMLAVELKKKVE